jgi:hypothetical protein
LNVNITDIGVQNFLRDLIFQLKIGYSSIVEAIIIRFMAEIESQIDVFGYAGSTFNCFIQEDDKLISGKRLFEILFNEFQKRNYDELESILTETERNYPEYLTPGEKEFLESRRKKSTEKQRKSINHLEYLRKKKGKYK